MDTGKLKRFAAEARVNLMDGVRRKLRVLGFDEDGHVGVEPELLQGATLYKGDEYPEAFYHQWRALKERIASHGVCEVVEEAAYTWFNRMMAIRILTKNELCEPILMTEGSASGYPLLLEAARMGRVPEMNAQERNRFDKLMEDDNLTSEQFSLLLTVWCHDNPIINACFGSINGYAELLLPDNIIRPDGFIALLNNTGFITDDDFKSAELIGWLYQFYISERKDEVMKKQKYAADEIPAATQIFTPNWIVKYMVENTILPQVEASDEILENAKYLVKNPDATPCKKVDLEDFKVADFACGSGHILNECFDLLFALYRDEAYSRKEAIEAIFTKNLLGIDIDLRAKQLAMFALLLKACQKDASFADAHCLPRVMTVPCLDKEYFYVAGELDPKGYLHHFFLGSETPDCTKELSEAIITLKDADVLGSIIKFEISSSTRRQLSETVAHWKSQRDISHGIMIGLPVMDFILALTDSYDAIVMNPPYMGASSFNNVLYKYVRDNYPEGKFDLMTIFMQVAMKLTKHEGMWAMINLPSWMSIKSFEDLRSILLESQYIQSLLHLGRGIFGSDFGSVAFVVKNSQSNGTGIYRRLFKEHVQVRSVEAIQQNFLNYDYGYFVANQENFTKIPGSPIGYWVSSNMFRVFSENEILRASAHPAVGFDTQDNGRFLRYIWEIDDKKYGNKWIACSKGGSFRKWYGNISYCVNWENNGAEMRAAGANIRNSQYYLRRIGATWSTLTSGKPSFRYFSRDWLFENKGSVCFPNDETNIEYLLGFLNSSVTVDLLRVLAPTIDFSQGSIGRIPFKLVHDVDIESIVKQCVSISKSDWDSSEISLDFQENPLVFSIKDNGWGKLEDSVADYELVWTNRFKQLHANEEELNRKFIEIYGLQDELDPHVEYEDITILQQGEINLYRPTHGLDAFSSVEEAKKWGTVLEDEEMVVAHQSVLSWNEDVIIKQLICYIVGCYMGRYRLDKPGLHIAHPNPSEEELADYTFSITGNETFQIDPDVIIPVLTADAPFYDNLVNYVSDFIRKVWGAESHTENMNFIDRCLGKPLNDYLMKDFWKYHKKMYQNRPIYWEFASPKGAFRALVYAHRMDKFTVEVLRSKYLLPYINFIEQKIANLEARATDLSTAERRELDNLRKKTLPELREYHDRVQQVAAETAARDTIFDLDDGIPHNHALFGSIVTKLK
ncbi:BREX-1 system adenine-specific DNA-methyltransferase PglX [uncultured Duncaniella sp.]|jgi:type I restriction-modification system DNA methylase subunit|uniref:BREX-1 system adenine-specific DNA-methyltransferase PglX n=1 Tax=uncultured Duncaniella sp. TaxID=2768039 RepID=UPI000F4A5E36|nr:BREX-1 system adenine-specific DNA-methyltransferase PglX [uncultured Duncaniella sp.]ROT16602.1 BREX-1 system adenine-specific DNA-methyltransferase PglX [Muribaculaceae bacterium Isolate-105 (HZI)]